MQLIASHNNQYSRRAIERIGAQFEVVLRDVIIRNDEKKSIAYYSMLEAEWPAVKPMLQAMYQEKYSKL